MNMRLTQWKCTFTMLTSFQIGPLIPSCLVSFLKLIIIANKMIQKPLQPCPAANVQSIEGAKKRVWLR